MSVGETPIDIRAVEVCEEKDVLIRVVCYEYAKPGRWICNLAARSQKRIHNGDGIGAVLWLKSGYKMLLVSSVDICCVSCGVGSIHRL